jgi:flotillin
LINRYRRCPSDKILVIYGGRKSKSSAKCVHGGGAFVWPIIEDYQYLSLTPISIDANLTNALSKQNIRVDVPCRFTVGVSTDPDSMAAAAERLLGLSAGQIQELARDILFGQLRLVIATMSIEELNSDRDKFLESISANVEVELKKIGLRLINVNVTDIKDESGYIEALGREAAAKAINEAKVRVAEQDKIGEIGKAEADRETRVRTAEANAEAVKGENEAKVAIAASEAYRREREAEAQRKAIASEKVQEAKALEEAYAAQKIAEEARAERERSTQNANILVPQEIEKRRRIIEAEAEAEKVRVNAKGEADATFAKMEAEAKGLYEVLRRVKGKKTRENTIYHIGRFTFDTQKQLLSIGDKQTKLTTKENELLALLCAHANEILQRDYALKTIWIDDNYFNAHSMDVYITKLRKHLKDDDQIEIINIHGRGYKLITPEEE